MIMRSEVASRMYVVKMRKKNKKGEYSEVSSFGPMTTTNGLNRGSLKVRILQPPLDRFQVRKFEPWTLPRTFSALAERGHPPTAGAGLRECLPTKDLQSFLRALCKLEGEQVSLQGLLARKPALLSCPRPARAWAAPNLGKVALAVLHAHV